jgi:hypothetical protein
MCLDKNINQYIEKMKILILGEINGFDSSKIWWNLGR